MEKILLKLCRERWLTRNEIAAFVKRNPESLRQSYINPMLEHGLLRLRYPEKPNRTDQAYTTVLDDNVLDRCLTGAWERTQKAEAPKAGFVTSSTHGR